MRMLCALIGFVCIYASSVRAGGPELVVDQPTYQFGDANPSETIKHRFRLTNGGNAALKISAVRTSCGCSSFTLSGKTIGVGEQVTLDVAVSLHGKKGDMREMIVVESDDPAHPRVQLFIVGSVKEVLRSAPVVVSLGRITIDEAPTATVEVIASDPSRHFKLTEVTSSSPNLAVEVGREGGGHRITIAARPPLPLGDLRGVITVRTDLDVCPQLEIPVIASVVGMLEVSPAELVLVDSSSRNAVTTRLVAITPGKCRSFRILRVEPPVETVKVGVDVDGHNGYQITLANVPCVRSLNGRMLRVTTDAPGMEMIEVPFRVLFE